MGTQAQRSRVLLVEDEFLLCDMIAEVLAEHGFEVFAVANAKDALRHLTCGSPCDILLTDINLAGSIDGAALARLARELRPNLPVVYASGSYQHDRGARRGVGRDLRAEAVQSGQALRDAQRDDGGALKRGATAPSRLRRGIARASGCDNCRR